jgi:hypothetical protein
MAKPRFAMPGKGRLPGGRSHGGDSEALTVAVGKRPLTLFRKSDRGFLFDLPSFGRSAGFDVGAE